MIVLAPCPKAHSRELDKACPPATTVARVWERLDALELELVARTERVDVGRLGIPVYLSVCGADARAVMPTRKQMGKGASPIQAEASALMELMERYSFFTFWRDLPGVVNATWSEAEARFGDTLMPVEHICASVGDTIAPDVARRLLDLVPWQFFPVTDLTHGREVWAPLNWFKKLGEFNGTSAGNTPEESLLQGLCELVERHVCCRIDRTRPEVPSIDPASVNDPVLKGLLGSFSKQGVTLILKDFSHNMPLPTVAALAWDTATFPDMSEIVFTAGTAASPAKAAIRAVTEVAQLAGDFCTNACYEASGLPKFHELAEAEWLTRGPSVPLDSLPSVEDADMCVELTRAIAGLEAQGIPVYAVATTNPAVGIPSHYSIAPGLAFRERDKNQCVGLFVGRILAEEAEEDRAAHGLEVLAACCPNAHYLPFFHGVLSMRRGDLDAAGGFFTAAEPLQPESDAKGLCAFYAGYCLTQQDRWEEALPALTRAVTLCPEMKEYWNLRGVARFKTGQYAPAARDFERALRLDKGSVMDIANLGLCHERLGHKEQARQYLRTAISLDPDLEFARNHLEALEEE